MVPAPRALFSKVRALHARRSRGQAMVEFALVLPIFVLFLVIAIDFGRVYYSYVAINNAAREGAAYAGLNPTNQMGTEARANQETNTQGQGGESPLVVTRECANSLGVTIACTTAAQSSGNSVTVAVEEQFTFLTPLVNNFFNNFTMRATATSLVLGYATSTGGVPPGGCALPIPSFAVSVTGGLSVFADPQASRPNSGVCNISGFNWTWGDGLQDVGASTGDPHTYASAGTYTITLEVTNQGGAATTTRNVTVPSTPPPTCARPTAWFTWISSGKTRTYFDASTVANPVNCPITDWLWTFTDYNGGQQSTAQNPGSYTYGNNSSHPVTLQVWNAGGTATVTRNS